MTDHPKKLSSSFLPGGGPSSKPASGHVNRIKKADVDDVERTFQVDVNGDGIIPPPTTNITDRDHSSTPSPDEDREGA